jgi:hypothetical protein
MTNRRLTTLTIVFALAVIPISVAAQDGFTVDVVATADCGVATFKTSIKDGEGPYDLIWDFGDADSDEMIGISELSIDVTHPYTDTGDYVWEVTASDNLGGEAQTSESIFIDGPSVVLTSVPFPPLVVLENGKATVNFIADVSGGKGSYTFSWDFDGGGSDSSEAGEASFTYTEAGKYQVSVNVTDECSVAGQDTLPVIVIDPDEEACHPMAQRIADGVNTLLRRYFRHVPWRTDRISAGIRPLVARLQASSNHSGPDLGRNPRLASRRQRLGRLSPTESICGPA